MLAVVVIGTIFILITYLKINIKIYATRSLYVKLCI